MKTEYAIETSYNNGYSRGYEAGKRDVARDKWISTEKKLPTKSDADEEGNVLAIVRDFKKIIINWEDVCRFTEYTTHWMHMPYYPKD